MPAVARMDDTSGKFPRLAHPMPTPEWLDAPDEDEPRRKLKFRTVFISDTHLGTSGCNAELLFDFLKSIECETLYLVGDIIDGWRLKRGWFWPTRHNDVVRRVLKMAKKGTRVIYVPGNHDEVLRDFIGLGPHTIDRRMINERMAEAVAQAFTKEFNSPGVQVIASMVNVFGHFL